MNIGTKLALRGNPEFAVAYQTWMEAHFPHGGFPLSRGIAMWARMEHGYEVSMEWKDGKFQSARFSNRDGRSCAVRYGQRTTKAAVKPGEPISLNAKLDMENL